MFFLIFNKFNFFLINLNFFFKFEFLGHFRVINMINYGSLTSSRIPETVTKSERASKLQNMKI